MLQIKSKYKIAKRLGAAIFEQTQTQKFSLAEARKTTKKPRGRNKSDYGRQLIEKQKVRFTYGLSEKQLSNYGAAAFETANPPESLHRSLETRLDNTAYRAGAPGCTTNGLTRPPRRERPPPYHAFLQSEERGCYYRPRRISHEPTLRTHV